MEYASILTAFNCIKAATEIAKLIKDSDISLEKAETKLKLAELVSMLADTKVALSDIKEELIEKNEEILKFKKELSLKQNVIYEAPFYWIRKDETKDGPFCPICWDADNKLIRLQPWDQNRLHCLVCKNYIDKKHNKPM